MDCFDTFLLFYILFNEASGQYLVNYQWIFGNRYSEVFMEELKVSIVVPVYNTNIEYFRQCIKSLVSQTYENIEILIVDDGSKDEM